MLTNRDKHDTKRLPMMPIRDVVIFPLHDDALCRWPRKLRPRCFLEEAMAGDKKIFLATQHDASVDEPRPNEIYGVGTVATIVQSVKLPDGNIKVLVEGVERGRVISVSEEEGFFRATVRTATFKIEVSQQVEQLVARVTHAVRAIREG